MHTIGIIGTGVMGTAIATGVHAAHPSTGIVLFDINRKTGQALAEEIGGTFAQSPKDVIQTVKQESGTMVLAVKPQHLEGLAREIGKDCEGLRLISIAAGRSIQTIEHLFPGSSVIRFMPNIAAKIGKSIVAVAALEGTDPDFLEEAQTIAGSLGEAVLLDESLISAFTGLSGSGIAYVFSFIHALALGGTENGIPYPKALTIAVETLLGAAELVKETGANPAELITRVTSAGGTTIKGIAALEKGAFTSLIMDAVRCATEKAETMEKGKA